MLILTIPTNTIYQPLQPEIPGLSLSHSTYPHLEVNPLVDLGVGSPKREEKKGEKGIKM